MSIRKCLHSLLQAEYKFFCPRLEPVGCMTALNWKPCYCFYSAEPKLKPLLKDRKYQFVLSRVLCPRMRSMNAHMLRAQTEWFHACLQKTTYKNVLKGEEHLNSDVNTHSLSWTQGNWGKQTDGLFPTNIFLVCFLDGKKRDSKRVL